MLVAVRPKPPFQAREKPSGRAHDSHSALGPQTDVRVLSPLQKEVLLNKEILAIHQDPSPTPGGVVSRALAPLHSEVWLRRLASGDAAVALFNGGSKNASLTLRFAALGLGLGAQSRCSLRDLWAHEAVGQHVGEYTREVPAHGTAVLRLRCSPPPPAPQPAPAPQQPRPAPSPPPVLDAAASELIDISRRSRVFDGIGALSGGAPQNTRPSLRCVFTPIALCCRWWDVAAAVRLPGAAAQPDPRRPVPARKGRGGADPEGRDGWRTLPRNCCRLLCFLPSSSDIVADRTLKARRRRRRKIGTLSRFATLPSRLFEKHHYCSSHMHTRSDGALNNSKAYNRGYEFWLLSEAKRRNPAIKTYGLAWGVPGWIGNGSYYSDDNLLYHLRWVTLCTSCLPEILPCRG